MSPDTCRGSCGHYDCMMARGDVLPEHVTAWTHVHDTRTRPSHTSIMCARPDGTIEYWQRYEPSDSARALHDAIRWARFCVMWQNIAIMLLG